MPLCSHKILGPDLPLGLLFSTMKKFIIEMTDPVTGEIFASNFWLSNRGEKTVVPREVAMEKSKKWFDSFLRGIEQDRDIYFSIMIKEFKESQLPLFPSAF